MVYGVSVYGSCSLGLVLFFMLLYVFGKHSRSTVVVIGLECLTKLLDVMEIAGWPCISPAPLPLDLLRVFQICIANDRPYVYQGSDPDVPGMYFN